MKKFLLFFLFFASTAFAVEPLFSLVPVGTLPTTVPPGGTVTAQYTVTNNAPYALQGIGLNTLPTSQTPVGVTQNTVGAGVCSSPFSLQLGASCILSLTITADNLQNGLAMGGPEVCFTKKNPSRCSVPSASAQLNVSASTVTAITAFAGGTDVTAAPFLVQSTGLGTDWATVPLPAGTTTNGAVVSTACNASLCIAAGVDDNADLPFILQTIDNGAHWSLATLPGGVTGLNSASVFAACNVDGCVLGYQTPDEPQDILQTLDNGTTWTNFFLSSSSLLNNYDVSCGAALCVVVGDIQSTFPATVYIAQSLVGTGTWAPANLAPLTTTQGSFFSSYCQGNLCFAGGQDELTILPLLAIGTTVSGVTTWSQVDLSGLGVQTSLLTISCSSTRCIAAGNKGTGTTPFVIEGSATGTGWVQDNAIPVSGGALEFSACSDAICILAGQDITGAGVLLQEATGALSWTSVDLLSLLPGYTAFTVFSVSCKLSHCTAVGYGLNALTQAVPVVFETINAGTSWSVATVQGAPSQGEYEATTTR